MENITDEIKHLQGCINDLISILALAALWSGREPSEMARALLDGLLGMQRLDFVYARLTEAIDLEPIEVVRWAQRYDRDVQAHEVGRAFDCWLTGDLPVSPLVIANPLGDGEVSIAVFRLGLQDHLGVLVAGSARRDFPTQIERLLLRVAANQTAIGLQEARLLSEQKRAARELEQRVAERTRQLTAANEELRKEIAERQRVEAELRRNEAYLAEGQKISHTGSGAWNVATGEAFWSQETYRIYGFEPGSVKPSYDLFFQIVHPEDQPFVEQTFAKVVRESSDYELDFRIVRPDDRVRYIHSLGHPVFNQASALVEVIGTVLDVTERKHAEAALRASNDELQRLNEELQVTNDELEETTKALESSRDELQLVNEELQAKVAEVSLANSDLRNLIESTDIGTIFLDRELRINRYTPQIPKLFNTLPTDINRPLAHFTHRLDYVNLQEDARQVLADLQTVEREVRSRDDHWYIVRLLPYRTEDDEIDGVVVAFVEITQRKRTEEALQIAQAELAHVTRVTTLGEMTSSIAHEVNQPLAAIVTNGDACLRMLVHHEPDIDGVGEAVEAMINDALRASEVIKRIRTLLKKATPEKTWMDINGMIQEVIALTANELGKNQVSLRRELEAGLQPVLGDRVQLQQVMLNLLLNGNEAMSQAGWQPRKLLIKSQKHKLDEVIVAVRDTGTGLKPQDAERIFDPFFTTKEGGLGLGLSISRTIIEAHGGRLWAAANEGKGTTLYFTLPTHSGSIP